MNHLLFIVPRLPEYDRASGDLRLFRILEILSAQYAVTLYNDGVWERFLPRDERYLQALQNLGVKVLLARRELDYALEDTTFHAVVLEFHHLAQKYCARVRRAQPSTALIVDSVDLHFVRESLQARTLGATDPDFLARKDAELRAYRDADYVWVVGSLDELALNRELPGCPLRVVPNIHTVHPQPPPRSAREPHTLLFVGGFLHKPNEDGILRFCNAILPHVERAIPSVRLRVIGDSPPPPVQALARHNVEVLGYVPSTTPYLDHSMVSIAPLRFGAGLKGKVTEALSSGLPVVTTSVGAQGIPLRSGHDCVIADDPVEFATAVISVLSQPSLWAALSANGAALMEHTFGYSTIRDLLLAFFRGLPSVPPDSMPRNRFLRWFSSRPLAHWRGHSR